VFPVRNGLYLCVPYGSGRSSSSNPLMTVTTSRLVLQMGACHHGRPVVVMYQLGLPLWSSGQSSWPQIRRPGFDFRHYQKKVVGLERGPLSLVSTTEELLDTKVAAPV
jgi:hypothetical protein